MNPMRGNDDEKLDALFRAYHAGLRISGGQREFHAQSLGSGSNRVSDSPSLSAAWRMPW